MLWLAVVAPLVLAATINHLNIQCRFTFQLEPLDGSPPFTAQKVITVNQTRMPRVGDVWPAWYDRANPGEFGVGAPGQATPEQLAIFREFGIAHPLDPGGGPAGMATGAPAGGDRLASLERLAQLHRDGVLSDTEFATEKARVLGS